MHVRLGLHVIISLRTTGIILCMRPANERRGSHWVGSFTKRSLYRWDIYRLSVQVIHLPPVVSDKKWQTSHDSVYLLLIQ